mmetsp:Transcript_10664/g.12227  ORF Transcript_10664/g.12227 Transcript_10664/m.12227 type:complete len:111 (-) Transcript_10664:363-695(-)
MLGTLDHQLSLGNWEESFEDVRQDFVQAKEPSLFEETFALFPGGFVAVNAVVKKDQRYQNSPEGQLIGAMPGGMTEEAEVEVVPAELIGEVPGVHGQMHTENQRHRQNPT